MPDHFKDFVLLTEEEMPMTYEDCMKSTEKQEWLKAIQEEKESLKKNKTWTQVNEEEARGKEVITSKWIFKTKDDDIKKARQVARGCQQKKNSLDFEDIFSSVVSTTSLRVLFALAAKVDLKIYTFDVKTAFLNGLLDKEIFMKIPEGYKAPGKICKLNRALYGL